MRFATIDIGTNSVLLLIVERDPAAPGQLRPLVQTATTTRLGQDVDRTKVLHPDAVARTLACLDDCAREIRKWRAGPPEVVCTSAAREAAGADAFIQEAGRRLDATPRIIGGEEEARLTFVGSLTGLSLRGEVGVFDIGGGSSEIVVGRRLNGGQVRVDWATSLDIGCVRLTERHFRADPPTAGEVGAVRHVVQQQLEGMEWRGEKPSQWVGIGGTVTTLVAIQLGLVPYDPLRVHGSWLSRDQIEKMTEQLKNMDSGERQSVQGLEAKRSDIIVAGALIAEELLCWSQAERLTISDRGVRWGVAAELNRTRLASER